jgi:hypothetical protein
VDSWRGDIHNLEVRIADRPPGGKLYVALWRRVTYDVELGDNWKWLRLWPNDAQENYPNWYWGKPPGAGTGYYTEKCGTVHYSQGPVPGPTWQLEEYLFKVASGPGAVDGYLQMIQGGVIKHTNAQWETTCSEYPGSFGGSINWQDDPSNFDPAAGSAVFKDDLYLDTSWSRVYLANDADYALATHRELQPPSAWEDGQIAITQNFGSFASGEPVYLIVVDNENRFSQGVLLVPEPSGAAMVMVCAACTLLKRCNPPIRPLARRALSAGQLSSRVISADGTLPP